MASPATVVRVLLCLSIFSGAVRAQIQLQFVQTIYQPTVLEEEPVGTVVTTVGAFYIDGGLVKTDGTFSLSSGEDAQLFSIETGSTATLTVGTIRTDRVFDRDAPGVQTEFRFDVLYTVRVSNVSEEIASAAVTVFLTDVNDNPPRFTERVFVASVLEQTPGGAPFFNVTADDADEVATSLVVDETTEDFAGLEYTVDNGRIIYNVTAGNELSHFALDADTGVLSVATRVRLDVDIVALYNLTVVATDGGGLTDIATVIINVLDSNDNPPQIISPLNINLTLSEDVALGFEIVEAINATDADSGLNALIRFAIIDGDTTNSFSLDAVTGQIVISSPLDREAGDIVNITVAARDSGMPPLQDTIQVLVYLLDVNDFVPTFEATSFEVSVMEELPVGTSVFQVQAIDMDVGLNGTVTYAILNNSGFFTIDSNSGLITTNRSIDREENNSFAFQVIARDNPQNDSYQLSSVTTVRVAIDDINDNAPIFINGSYRADILDNVTAAEVIVRVVANDADVGSNGEVGYQFVMTDPDRPNDFRIDPASGFVYRNRQLRFEDQMVYRYTVQASDNGDFPLIISVDLTIYVYDVNRRPPQFERDSYNTTLLETTPVRTVVLNVSATDPDPGPIGTVQYKIVTKFDEAGSFVVNETTGEISVGSRLDFDLRNFIFFQVEAYDGGFPEPFTDTTNITIYLVGENDEAPSIIFPEGFQVTVPENEQPPINFITLTNYTFDPDASSGGEFFFSIHEIYDQYALMGNGSVGENTTLGNDTLGGSIPTFSINMTSGQLTSHRIFDRELQPEGIVVAINTTDFGAEPQSKLTNITVMIGDKNDQSPYFSTNASAEVYEFMPPGTLVLLEYRAQDNDIGSNAKLEYTIIEGDENNRFLINPLTGGINTTEVLNKTVQNLYNLSILVRDGGIPQLHAFGRIFIEVIDANDQTPIFSQAIYTGEFFENSTIGTPIFQVNATDSDIGTNAIIEYFIAHNISNSTERFQIDNSTGEISTFDMFDREIESNFELTILAVDQGLVPRTGYTIIQLFLLDNNDNTPMFNQSNYVATLIENTEQGVYLTTVNASDLDAVYPNNALNYTLRGNRSTELQIDPLSGEVFVGGMIDRDIQSTFIVVAVASDLGEPSRSAEANLTIIIEDINDEPPIFVPQSLNLNISESSSHGTEVGYVVAVDIDSPGNNSLVRYSVIADFSGGRFTLHSETGLVTFVQFSLDRENTPYYEMIIRATDHGVPQLFTDAVLNITIEDVNDFDPIFDQVVFTGSVLENSLAGVPILFVSATDQDSPLITDFRYSILNISLSQYFVVNATAGLISTGPVMLDFENQVTFSFAVEVSDSSLPPRSTTSMVEITVLDSNDHPPQFTQSNYSAVIRENLAPGTTILRIITEDIDTKNNTIVRYSIQEGPELQYFNIDPESGVIYTTFAINREMTPFFNLTVIANNSLADITLSSETQVYVSITDLNDTHPSFDPVIMAFVPENATLGSIIYTLDAVDGDEGINGNITYTIVHGNDMDEFLFDSQTGEFRLNHHLDYEIIPFYTMYIMATDGSSSRLSNFTNLLINVQNLNDNPPTIASAAYNITISSQLDPGDTVLHIAAFDQDKSTNAQLMYNITSSNDPDLFALQSSDESTIITISSVVSYAFTSFTLVVEVSDGENIAEAKVTINIQGGLITLPYFLQQTFDTTISEDFIPGEQITNLFAQNADDYNIESGNIDSIFDVSSDGRVTLASPGLNFEARPVYQLTISAVNNASNTYTVLTINIRDVNEFAPQFILDTFLAAIPDTAPLRDPFLRVVAIDRDGSPQTNTVSYSIVSSDILVANTFEIDAQSGEVSLTRSLDHFESGNDRQFIINIRAINEGSTPQLFNDTTVNITVLDGNSYDPYFSPFSYTVSLNENVAVNLNIVNVTAFDDDDSGSQGSLTYGMLGDHRFLDFRISTSTGEIFTNYQLDYERQTIYTLVAVAADGGNPSRSSTAAVLVYIIDLNDNFPIWEQDRYFVAISESATTGTSVVMVAATDADQRELSQSSDLEALRAQNGYVTYNISAGNLNGAFEIDPDTGLITVSTSLDRERFPNYTLTLNATDGGGQYSNSYVEIIVNDANDEVPEFSQSMFTVNIPEDAPNGTFVFSAVAMDTDLNQNAEIRYQIGGGNINETFQQNSTTGVIALVNGLDREEISSYALTLEAVDMGALPLTGQAQLVVIIDDINEFPPVFDNTSYSTVLLESEVIGFVVLQISTSDLDAGANSTATFKIIPTLNNSNNTNSSVTTMDLPLPFGINSSSGEIFTTDLVDFERVKEYEFVVMATDSGPSSEQLSAQVNVTILVLDANDNEPEFNQAEYVAQVRENSPSGMFVIAIRASDLDSGINAEISFLLDYLGDTDAERNFVIDASTGNVTLSGVSDLDYERVPSYQLLVNASDFGAPTLQSSVFMTIEVLDANDNTPQFSDALFFGNISENLPPDSFAGQVFAEDQDDTTNGFIVYNITGLVRSEADCLAACGETIFCQLDFNVTSLTSFLRDPPFYINPQTGAIASSQILNRESVSDFVLLVEARDSADNETQLSNTTCIHIAVLDQNDEFPVFSQPIYYASISEYTESGIFVIQVLASDRDAGSNANVTFNLVSDMGSFAIAPQTGRIFTLIGEYNRESTASYNVTVVAQDEGEPPLSSTSVVMVTILDENDSPPTFSELLYTASIEENLPAMTEVLNLNATDEDVIENAEITYSIESAIPVNHFELDPRTGVLTTTRPLDREDVSSYLVTVIARDNGSISLSSTTEVNVTVLDANDMEPEFIGAPFVVNVSENSVPVDPVLTLRTQDGDIGTNALVLFTLGDIMPPVLEGVFEIDASTGELILTTPLNAELSLKVNVTVIASNEVATPRQQSQTVISVNVGDLNDNAPQFDQVDYIIPISEALAVGSVFIVLTATDLDTTIDNSISRFSITGGYNASLFQVDPLSGNLSVVATLDRESEPIHVLEVMVTDNGTPELNSNTTVTIILQDFNDNVPVFQQSRYTFTAVENQPSSTLIGQVKASDIDQAVVSYFLHENNTDGAAFTVNSTTGELFSARPLDREDLESYMLVLVATDNGLIIERTAEVTVNVTVLDENDNKPVFNQSVYTIYWSENTAIGAVLITLQAEDADIEMNAVVMYSLVPCNDSRFFSINVTTGAITLELSLDREQQDRFEFVVRADDLGSPSLSGNATVILEVLDENDNTPLLNSSLYSAVLNEDTIIGSAVVYIGASDADIGNNAAIQFYLYESFNGTFSIDPDSGIVTLTKGLDFESMQSFTFLVFVEDDGNQSLSSSSVVFVEVVDLNDNPPVFDSTVYYTSIPENAVLQTVVFDVPATDADSTSNAALRYSILSGNNEAKFSIGEVSGIVTISDYLDREITQFYSLSLRVVDLGIPQRTSTTEVEVTVIDVNDHAPEFLYNSYFTATSENTSIRMAILTVAANDLDAEQNANLTYAIVSGDQNSTFEIDSISGVISIAKRLDFESIPAYTLSVSVTDNGVPLSFRDITTIYITVLNVNEHPPLFSQDTYYANISESTVLGAPVGRFVATDADSAAQTQIIYSLVGLWEDSPFNVNEYEGTVFVKRTIVPGSFALTLTANDGNFLTEVNLSITVLPDNFTGPVFDLPSFSFEVSEETATFTSIGQLIIGSGTLVNFTLDSAVDNMFAISQDGQLELLHELDREQTSAFVFNAFTTGVSGEMVFTIVTVIVADYNDFAPTFDSQVYEISLSELTQVGTPLLTFNIYDHDSLGVNSEFQLQIVRGDNDGIFEINPEEQRLYLNSSLDFESRREYILTINVSNHLARPELYSTTEVRISILDENDNAPSFSMPYYQLAIPADLQSGSEILRLEAMDPDSGFNSELVYAITHLDVPYSFIINDTSGIIVTNVTFAPQQRAQTLVISAIVSDRGSPSPLSDVTTIFVDVRPVNNFAPVFLQPTGYGMDVPETIPPSSSILQVSASDPDTNVSFAVEYSIISGDPVGKFSIDSTTGILSVAVSLDYNENNFYMLMVEATDFGSPQLSSLIPVNITVLDINNHDPMFQAQAFEVSILENTTIGSFVIEVLATDPDATSVTHVITVNAYQNGVSLFRINSTSGEIHTNAPVDREYADRYELLVSAIDSGYEVRRSTSVPVVMILLDLNDSPPEFNQSQYQVLRLLSAGQPVVKVMAYDPDILGSELTYAITADSSGGKFTIDETSGQIIATMDIPEVINQPYELNLSAFDGLFQTTFLVYLNPTSDGDFCEGAGFCTSVRSVNCTFDIFPYTQCNPFCVGQYNLSPENQVCVFYSCPNTSLAPCTTLNTCIPPNESCDGICPEGMSVCPTTNVCHTSELNQSCDGSNVTCLLGQNLVQRDNGERYCANSSLLPPIGQECSGGSVVYCEGLDECSNITAEFLCQACPTGLSICSHTGQCLSNPNLCCPVTEYYCEVLNQCVSTGERCELSNVVPNIDSSLIYIDSITDFSMSSSAGPGYTIAFILSGNSNLPAVDSQGEEVSIAVIETSAIPTSDGEWQYSICGDLLLNSTCDNIDTEWIGISDVTERRALVLPNTARLRFERKRIELEGAVWLRAKLWDGNEDGYLSPHTRLVRRIQPHFNSTIPFSNNGAFSQNSTILTILVNPLITKPEFDSAASYELSSIAEDIPFVDNRGNTVMDITTAVNTPDFSVLPEDRIEGFPSNEIENVNLYEQLLPENARATYYAAVSRVNPTRIERNLAMASGQRPGVGMTRDSLASFDGRFQVSFTGDERLYTDLDSLLVDNGTFLLLNTSARLRFLPSKQFCGEAAILLRAWDGYLNGTLATRVNSGHIIANVANGTHLFSEYNLNRWEQSTINVECALDEPILLQQELNVTPAPYQILQRYERLFTTQIALDINSLRARESELAGFLQLVLQQEIDVKRIYPSLYSNSSYISFSVERDSLTFDDVRVLILERESTLADLNFKILQLSKDTAYGAGIGCPDNNPQHYLGDIVSSLISQLSTDSDQDYLGMAVVGISASSQEGAWQYHRGNWSAREETSIIEFSSAIWLNIPLNLSETSALLLHGSDRIRFLPVPDAYWNESQMPPPVRVKAWDMSVGDLPETPPPEISLTNINTLSYIDTLQSLTHPIGLFSVSTATLKAARWGCDGNVNSGLVHDVCCICGGDGSSCKGCDGTTGSNMARGACDKCGDNSECLGCDYIPFSNTQVGICGECISYASVPTAKATGDARLPLSAFTDCSGTCYGTALTDDCSVCSGGNTTHQYNIDRDCADLCFGSAIIDDCGDCTGPGTSLSYNELKDCTGICGGPYRADSCGNCQFPDSNGRIAEFRDCAGVCNGSALLDFCGGCYGGNTSTLANSTVDTCGVCGGVNTTCIGCDDAVDSGRIIDECGDCGGNDCGCFQASRIIPSRGPRTGGTEVTVHGSGFFLNDSSLLGFTFDPETENCGAPFRYPTTLEFIAVSCQFTAPSRQFTVFGVAVDQGRVLCVTESTEEFQPFVPGFSVRVRIASGLFSNPIDFFYDDYSSINVSQISPTDTEIEQETTVTFSGVNFINAAAAACLLYNFDTCVSTSQASTVMVPATYYNSTSLSCLLPVTNIPCQVTIRLSLDGQESGIIYTTQFRYQFSAPLVTSVHFSDDLTNLIVRFDRRVAISNDMPLSCENTFSSNTILLFGGSSALCYFSTDLQDEITIKLPPNASIKVGSSLQFLNSAVVTSGHQYSYAVSDKLLVGDSIRPVAVLNGPSSIPPCGSVMYSAIDSLYPGYGSLEYRWSIYTQDSMTDSFDKVIDYLDSLSRFESVITLNTTYFISGIDYYLEIVVANSIGLVSKPISLQLSKDSTPQIHVYNQGSTYREIYESEDLLVQSNVMLPDCGDPIGQVDFEWDVVQIVESRQPLLSRVDFSGVDRTSADIFIPANNWVQNTRYNLILTVRADDNTIAVAQLLVSILPTTIEARIHGGDRTVTQNRTLILDARNSIENANLQSTMYTWSCSVIGSFEPCYNQSESRLIPVIIPQSSFVSIPSQLLIPNQSYNFTLVLSQGLQRAQASVVVDIVPPAPARSPIVEILPFLSVDVSSRPVTIEALVYSSEMIESVSWNTLDLPGESTIIDLEDPANVQSQVIYPTAQVLSNQSTDITSYSAVPLLSSISLSQTSRANLVLRSNVLQAGEVYTFQLTATNSGGTSSARVKVSVDATPHSATLAVKPQAGTALETTFTLTVSNAKDDSSDSPFLYRFGLIRKQSSTAVAETTWLSGVTTDSVFQTSLPSGDMDRNFTISILARIYDRNRGYSDVVVNAVVVPQRDNNFVNARITSIRQEFNSNSDWSKAISNIASLILEVTSSNLSRVDMDTLKKESLDLFLDIFTDHIPRSETHLETSASVFSRLTAGGSVSDQGRLALALQEIVMWFRNETAHVRVPSDVPLDGASENDPLLLLTKYRSSQNRQLLSADLTETILSTWADILSGETDELVERYFVENTQSLAYTLCQESVLGEQRQLVTSKLADVYVLSGAPIGAFNASNILINFSGSVLNAYNEQTCIDKNLPCLETCFQSVTYKSDIFANRFISSQTLQLGNTARDMIASSIDGADPEEIVLVSNIISISIPIPSQGRNLEVQNLAASFQVFIPMATDVVYTEGSRPLCLFRATDSGGSLEVTEWSIDTLVPPQTTNIGSTAYYVCNFTHLTEFAIGLLPPPIITPPPISSSSVATPPSTSTSDSTSSSEPTSSPTTATTPPPAGSPVVGIAAAIIIILIVVVVAIIAVVVFLLWRRRKKRKMKIVPGDDTDGQTEEETRVRLVKSGPLTPEESKVSMNIIQLLDNGEREVVGTMNVLPSIRLRELRSELSDTFTAFRNKPFYFLTRQLCDIEPAAEQQQFVSLVFGDTANVAIFVREVSTTNNQTKLHFCICGKAAQFECSNCSAQGYCSSECQMNDWKDKHQKDCARLSEKRRRSEVLYRRQSSTLSPISERPMSLGIGETSQITPTQPNVGGAVSPTDWKSFLSSTRSARPQPLPPVPARQPLTSFVRVNTNAHESEEQLSTAPTKATTISQLAALPPIPDSGKEQPATKFQLTPKRTLPPLSMVPPNLPRTSTVPMPGGNLQPFPRKAFMTPPTRPNMVSPSFPTYETESTQDSTFLESPHSLPGPAMSVRASKPTPQAFFTKPVVPMYTSRPVRPSQLQPLSIQSVESEELAQSVSRSPGAYRDVRNEPLLESDEEDYESSSGSGRSSAAHTPIASTVTQDSRMHDGPTHSTTIPTHSTTGPSTSRPPSLAPRKRHPSDVRLRSRSPSIATTSSESETDSESSSEEDESPQVQSQLDGSSTAGAARPGTSQQASRGNLRD